jgi:hypothetical protein
MSTQKQIVSVPFRSTDGRWVGVAVLKLDGRPRAYIGENMWLPFGDSDEASPRYSQIVEIRHESDGVIHYFVHTFMFEGSGTPESVFQHKDGWSLNYTHK